MTDIRVLLQQAEGDGCPYCGLTMRSGTQRPPSREHILPKSRGGGDGAINIAIVCAPCNNDKSDWTLDEFAARLTTGDDPRAPRVRAFWARWAMATAEGVA